MAQELHNIPGDKGYFITSFIVATAIAPAWFLFQFAPHVWDNNEFSKLILISLAVGVPVQLVFSFIEGFKKVGDVSDEEEAKLTQSDRDRRFRFFHIFAAFRTFATFYLPIVFAYFWGPFALDEAIQIALWCGFLLVLFNPTLPIAVLVVLAREAYDFLKKKVTKGEKSLPGSNSPLR